MFVSLCLQNITCYDSVHNIMWRALEFCIEHLGFVDVFVFINKHVLTPFLLQLYCTLFDLVARSLSCLHSMNMKSGEKRSSQVNLTILHFLSFVCLKEGNVIHLENMNILLTGKFLL